MLVNHRSNSSWGSKVLLLVLSVLVLCIVSSAAFKYGPRATKARASDPDESLGVAPAVSSALDGNTNRRKSNFDDYVFAKVNSPKLVRPRFKNSRAQQENEASDEDDDDDVQAVGGGAEESSEKEDDHNNDDDDDEEDTDDSVELVIKRGNKSKKQQPVAAKKGKQKHVPDDQDDDEDDRDQDDDENSAEIVAESSDKNRKAEKQRSPVHHPKEKQVVVEKATKKVKTKTSESESGDVEERPQKKKNTKKKDAEEEDDGDNVEKQTKKKNKKQKSPKSEEEKSKDYDDDRNPWWDPFGFFDATEDEKSFLEVIQKKRDQENEKIKKQNIKNKHKEEESTDSEVSKSWLSYLNRKPFSFLFDIDAEEDDQTADEKRDTEPEKEAPDMKRQKKRTGPLSTDDFEEILAYIPSFVPNYTSIDNIDCRRQGQIFHRQLRGQKLWAFQMIDAGGKIGSGILHGNINQLGNFDLCTEISTKVKITDDNVVRVKGKYCLAHLDIQATDESLRYLMHLIHGKSLLRSTINDPSHFVPRFTTLNWGVCVPAACTVEDVQEFLEASLEDYNSTGIRLNIQIDEENCYVAHKVHWNRLLKENYEIVAILACVSSVLVVILLATLNQYWTHWRGANIVIQILDGHGGATDNGQKDGEDDMVSFSGSGDEPEPQGLLTTLILQFSLKDSWYQLTETKEGDVECIHGIKALSSIGLFCILKVWQLIRAPYANRIDLTEILNSSWSLILRSPMLFMDIFLILTGFLTSYSLLRRHEATGKFGAISHLIGKLIRMIPLIALTTLFQAHIWPHLGSGPQWNEIVGKHGKLCEEKWWKNLLFIQTSDRIEDACDPISYQFAVQMGLCLGTPLIIWAMHKRPHVGLGVFGAVNILSVAMRFSQTQSNRLAPIFYHGIKMTQIYRTMDLDHGSIVHRATPFINGIALGFVLMHFGKNVKIPKSSNIALWILALSGLGWCVFSQTHVTQRDYVYDAQEMAQFAAWAPLIWSYSIMWIIFACFSGNGDFVNRILSAKPLIFISRISFALHFVQYIILSSVSAKTRAVGHFEVSHFVNTFELCVIVLISVALTLTFDLPMQNIRDLLRSWTLSMLEVLPATAEERERDETTEDKISLTELTNTELEEPENGSIFRKDLDRSNMDWVREAKEYSKGREERNHIESNGHSEGNSGAEVEEDEEEEGIADEYSEEEREEGGNSVPINELDDIWGSDNE